MIEGRQMAFYEFPRDATLDTWILRCYKYD